MRCRSRFEGDGHEFDLCADAETRATDRCRVLIAVERELPCGCIVYESLRVSKHLYVNRIAGVAAVLRPPIIEPHDLRRIVLRAEATHNLLSMPTHTDGLLAARSLDQLDHSLDGMRRPTVGLCCAHRLIVPRVIGDLSVHVVRVPAARWQLRTRLGWGASWFDMG